MDTLKKWFSYSIDETIKTLDSNIHHGLSETEAQQRLAQYGLNKLQDQKKKSVFQIFFHQLNDTLIYVLFGAVLITLFLHEYIDAIIILIVIILNACIGTFQELKAGNAIDALKKLTSPKAIVNRDNHIREINAEELVIGDLVMLDAGRYIPADLRLIETANLKIDESALTGESVPAEKDAAKVLSNPEIPLGDQINIAFMSTLVTYGRGIGVVVATAHETEIGKIATLIKNEEEVVTPLEKKLSELGATLGKIAIAICIIIFVIGSLQGRNIADMFLTSVSLAVASIPEGLAAIVAIVLSIGVTKMAKRKAIIKKLPAVETLGSVNVICSDKTGTLTQNKMTVVKVFTFTDSLIDIEKNENEISIDTELLVKGFVLNSDATLEKDTETGDPTEVALLRLADQLNTERSTFEKEFPRIQELAFDSDRKMMSTFHENENQYYVFTKGAIDNLILKCKYILENGDIIPITEAHHIIIQDIVNSMSNEALRTLGIAFKISERKIDASDFEQDLVLIGVAGMIDPPREEVKISILKAKKAGIKTVMITGDHKNTALAIAKELHIAENVSEVITGADINRLSAEELSQNIHHYSVFARVSPENKVQIVKALQAHQYIVSMTGDGVNDAPSLNAADIGVAMGITGTDVAKNASDMILADDNFSTIVTAVEEGRKIYKNIKKSVIFLLTSNVGEVFTMLIAILAGMPIPLIATQLLWINLITDSLPAIALGLDPGNNNVMHEKPRKSNESFFAHGSLSTILIGGLSIGLVTITSYYLGFREYGFTPFDENIPNDILEYARTIAFMTIISCQLFFSFTFRDEKQSIFKAGIFKNKYLNLAVVVGCLLQLLVLELPLLNEAFKLQSLHLLSWIEIIGLGLIPLFILEFIKIFKK